MNHHLIFEGAELSGKSWIMSQVYNHLEKKYGKSQNILDGCHWFNTDIGIYGTSLARAVIKNYIRIFSVLEQKNLIVEKFHISDIVYNQIYNDKKINYKSTENKLAEMGFKIVFIKFKPDIGILKKRIQDRLNLYPHYKKILKTPEWYIGQQSIYEEALLKSFLPVLTIETDLMPDENYVKEIFRWIGE